MKRSARDSFAGLAVLASLAALAGCQTLADRLTPKGEPAGSPAAFRRSARDSATGAQTPMPEPGRWWRVFQDPVLDSLVDRVEEANPEARAALARVEQSYAVFGISRAARFPTLRGDASASWSRDSLNNLLFPIDTTEYDRYRLGASAAWEIDLWGRVRGAAQRDRLRAEAETASYEGVLLSLQANLARQYFAYRSAEAELGILRDAVSVRKENLDLQQSRLELGAGIELDVSRSQVELETARAAAEAADRSRGKLEHAIAILVGVAPSELGADLARRGAGAPAPEMPSIPAGVPSTLLERRPDLRAAERNLRAAAVQVGVRRVDFLPKVTLTGSGGVASLSPGNLIGADSTLFDLGPQADIPLFAGGGQGAAIRQAEAQWREAAAQYHGALLNAVREVDDALWELESLARERRAQREAVRSAATAAELSDLRYRQGLVSYLEFVDAERSRLQALRAENALSGEYRAAVVRLIQALGGKW